MANVDVIAHLARALRGHFIPVPPDPLWEFRNSTSTTQHDLAPPKVEDNEEYPLFLEIDEYFRRQVNNEAKFVHV